jgi:hypothetical protein
MKLLFLDFDGVLNSTQSTLMHWQNQGRTLVYTDENCMSQECCSNLRYLMDTLPDLYIVVSSSWRLMYSPSELKTILQKLCHIPENRIIGTTPYLPNKQRGNEIQSWLDENESQGSELKYEIDDFMIIDDDSDMAHLKETNFLQTDGDLGFTIKDCRKLLERFRGTPTQKGDW